MDKPLLCPCCKSIDIKNIDLHTDWGLEYFCECKCCGVIFRDINAPRES